MIKHITSARLFALVFALATIARVAGAKPTHEPVAIDPVIAAMGNCEAKQLIQAARPGESALVCDAHAPRASHDRVLVASARKPGITTVEHIGR